MRISNEGRHNRQAKAKRSPVGGGWSAAAKIIRVNQSFAGQPKQLRKTVRVRVAS